MAQYNKTYEAIVALLLNTRKIKGYSQREMTERIGFGLNTIVKFEKGRNGGSDAYRSVDVLQAYCKALGVTVNYNFHEGDVVKSS